MRSSRSLVVAALLGSVLAHGESSKKSKDLPAGVEQIGTISAPAITESSGIVRSRQFTNVFWTHNDHGNATILFAIKQNGDLIGQFAISGNEFEDWEDIACDDKGNLFLGDIGNNDAKRTTLRVHQVVEPDPTSKRGDIAIKRSWTMKFPEAPFDCESLFIHGTNGYVISKVFKDARASIYSFPLADTTKPVVLKPVVETTIDSPVTGADLSPDGSLLGIVSKGGVYVYDVRGDIRGVSSAVPFHVPFKGRHVEACTFISDGLLATAESREIFLFKDPRFRMRDIP